MKYSIDSGTTWHDAKEGVRIICEGQSVPVEGEGDDEPGELHINATSEGLIMDVWVTRSEGLDHNAGTSCEMTGEIITRLVEGNSSIRHANVCIEDIVSKMHDALKEVADFYSGDKNGVHKMKKVLSAIAEAKKRGAAI